MGNIRCTHCGGLNPAGATWCGQCLARFEVTPPPPPSTAAADPPATGVGTTSASVVPSADDLARTPFGVSEEGPTWSCQTCGHSNPIRLDVCAGCGMSFSQGLEFGRGPRLPSVGLGGGAMRGRPLYTRHAVRRSLGESFSQGVRLIALGWRALKMDPELMVFPAIALIGGIAVSAGLWAAEESLGIRPARMTASNPLLWIEYLVIYLIAVYCEAGVVAAALIRFSGGDPTVGDGFRAAARKVGPLAVWAAISSTVAILIRMLEERTSRWISTPAGLAWASVTYFVVPVIMVEGLGAGASIKRSGSLFWRNWRETIVGGLGIGLVIALLMMGAILFAVALVYSVGVTVGLVVGIVSVLGIAVVGATLSGIVSAALYRYAVEGEAPIPFSVRELRHAFPSPVPQPGVVV